MVGLSFGFLVGWSFTVFSWCWGGFFWNVSELNWYTGCFDKHWCKEALAGICLPHL